MLTSNYLEPSSAELFGYFEPRVDGAPQVSLHTPPKVLWSSKNITNYYSFNNLIVLIIYLVCLITPINDIIEETLMYLEHGGSAAQDNVGVKSSADVDGAVLHALVHRLRDRRHEVGVRELKWRGEYWIQMFSLHDGIFVSYRNVKPFFAYRVTTT